MDYETLSTIYELLQDAYDKSHKEWRAITKSCLAHYQTCGPDADNPFTQEQADADDRYKRYAHAYFEFCDVMWGANGRKKEI